MAHEERLVDRDIFDADDAIRLEFDNSIYEKKRIPVREYRSDLVYIQNGHGKHSINGRLHKSAGKEFDALIVRIDYEIEGRLGSEGEIICR